MAGQELLEALLPVSATRPGPRMSTAEYCSAHSYQCHTAGRALDSVAAGWPPPIGELPGHATHHTELHQETTEMPVDKRRARERSDLPHSFSAHPSPTSQINSEHGRCVPM